MNAKWIFEKLLTYFETLRYFSVWMQLSNYPSWNGDSEGPGYNLADRFYDSKGSQ